MKRIVEPELLDELPPAHPLAQHSRNDLQRLNAWMGNAAILARELKRLGPGPKRRRILDIGAGDGRFMWQVAQRLPAEWRGTRLDLLDRQAIISPPAQRSLEDLGWQVRAVQSEVVQWLLAEQTEKWSFICANLFLHHFAEEPLKALLQRVSECTETFIALEPRRTLWGFFASCLVGVIGCNRVTRHDAKVSVRAGFRDHALSELWPREHWRMEERAAGVFSHLFIARRIATESVQSPSASAWALPQSHG